MAELEKAHIPAYRTHMQKDDKAQAKTGVRPLRSGRQTGMPGTLDSKIKVRCG
jgi:hypothetical protein